MAKGVSSGMIVGMVRCNQYDNGRICSLPMDLRFRMDNRICHPVPNEAGGYLSGYVNFGFSQNFLMNGGVIGNSDSRPVRVVGGNPGEYRYVRYNGNWFVSQP